MPELLVYSHQGRHGHLGEIVLNRPQALNAINMNMSQKIGYALDRWQDQAQIKAVIIRGEGPRAFCAGGDLKILLNIMATHQQPGGDDDFLRHQYRLVHQYHTYPKPLIVLCHGLTFGGGAGIVGHAGYRLCDPDCTFAMPETRIGFVPDVGAMHFFNQCPGEVGTFMALTSHQANAADVLYCGLMDGIWPYDQTDALIQAVTDHDTHLEDCLNTCMTQYACSQTSWLKTHRAAIDDAFRYDSVAAILNHLADANTPWHTQVLTQLKQRSPHSLALTLAGLRHCRGQSLAACLNTEYVLAWACLGHPDLNIGIKSAIITKDHQPHWHNARPDAIDPDRIATYLQKSFDNPLALP